MYIGQESPLPSMQDCSVVTATYELGEGMYGRIGVIGPKRMDYDKVVGTLKTLMVQLDEIFHRDKKDNENRRWKRPVEEIRKEGISEEIPTRIRPKRTYPRKIY